MNESTLIINKPFSLKQKNGRPIYVEIKRPNDRIKEMEENIDNKHYDRLESYKEMLKVCNVKEIKINHELNFSKLERIVITPNAKGYISTYFLEFMQSNNIPIYWLNGIGMIESCFMPMYFKRPSIIIKQCESRISGKNVEIAKYLIKLKLESQEMSHLIPNLNKSKSIKDVLQVEGNASRAYYQQWEFDDIWEWNGRHGRTTINANAIDPVNSILNLGYSLLAQQMSETLLKRGFELSIGFMHNSETSKTYWNMLTYDFIEPYRVWIDNSVLKMIENKTIKPNDFTYNEDKTSMIFKNKALKTGIDEFTTILKPLEHKSLPIIRTVEQML